jgi:two-component SAPR family response regulator
MDTLEFKNVYRQFIDKYKLLTENANEFTWVLDVGNRCFKYMSPSVYNLRGVTVEEAMHERIRDCMTPESIKKMRLTNFSRLIKFLAGNRSEKVVSNIDEFQLYCKDDTIKTFKTLTILIFNKQTNNIDILGVSRDITVTEKNSFIENIQENITTSRVYCFGKFLVYEGHSDSPVKWRTSKSEELCAFLFHNRNFEVQKWKICEALWPECDPEKISNKLHTTIYTMKQSLLEAGIFFNMHFQNGYYHIYQHQVFSDVLEFEKIIAKGIVALTRSDEHTVKKYERAISLYENDYMESNDYLWAISKNEQYREQFKAIANALICYYMAQHDYVSAQNTILKMLDINNLDEDAHELLLKMYILKNDHSSFLNHYNKMCELFLAELKIMPRESIIKLYKSFI